MLKVFGYELIGYKWHESFGPEKYNPGGYWTLTIDKLEDGYSGDCREDQAIKIIGEPLVLTDPNQIDQLIICKRDPEAAVNSADELLKDINQPIDRELLLDSYWYCYTLIRGYVRENDLRHHTVTYENLIDNPDKEVQNLCEFVGESHDKIKQAVKLIRR